MPQTTLLVGRRLLRVGCQFHVVVSFTCTYHLEKFVETCIYFLWFHFPSQEKKKKKDHEHKFQKKKESGEGN